MYLFRIHIRPGGGDADMPTTFAHCIKNEILGVGWRVDSLEHTSDWDVYHAEACKVHGKVNTCHYIKKYVKPNDLVWTRDTQGQYYLAKVVSGWEYWTNEESRELDIDIANVFRCEMKRVPIDAVPGKVVACFRAPRTMQEVASESAFEYSKFLWNSLTARQDYEIDGSLCGDIFMLLDDEETEDLLFVYLQTKGWYLLPNSRKADTMAFEFLAVRPESGEIAAAQVKTGYSSINRDDYSGLPHKTFLFQANEIYEGTEAENVICIERAALLKFLLDSQNWLPEVFRMKLALAKGDIEQARRLISNT